MGRTKKRAQTRKQEQRNLQRRNIIIGVAIAAVVIAALAILATRPIEVSVSEAILTRYADLPVSETERGFPILGNPQAPAELVEYSSFDCPHCQRFHEDATVNLIDRVRAGELSITYVPVYGTGGIPNGDEAAKYAICAGQQGRFWEYHDLLFGWNKTYVAAAFQTARLTAGAEELGLDMTTFNACVRDSDTAAVLDNALAAFRQVQLPEGASRGTPLLMVNDEHVSTPTLSVINGLIDTIMTSAVAVPLFPDAPVAIAEPTVEATEEVEVTEEAEATETPSA
jgi:protein-disulfide isomerase